MRTAIALTLALLCGCVKAQFIATGPSANLPAKDADQVELYVGLVPNRPARVLGLIVTDPCGGDLEEVFAAMKAKAAEMGADAVVNITQRVLTPNSAVCPQGSAVVWDARAPALAPPDATRVSP